MGWEYMYGTFGETDVRTNARTGTLLSHVRGVENCVSGNAGEKAALRLLCSGESRARLDTT